MNASDLGCLGTGCGDRQVLLVSRQKGDGDLGLLEAWQSNGNWRCQRVNARENNFSQIHANLFRVEERHHAVVNEKFARILGERSSLANRAYNVSE